jgi:hypothetical protein
MGALDLDRFQLRILYDEILALGDLVAAAFVLGGNRLAGLFIDENCQPPCATSWSGRVLASSASS